MNPQRRRAGVLLAAVTLGATLTGCGQVINPYTTELQYDAADGVSATVGDLKAVNLLIVNDDKTHKGALEGLVYNKANEDRQLTLSVAGTDTQVTVPAGQSVRLDGKANGNGSAKVSPVEVASIGDSKPGDQIDMTLKATPGGSTQVAVPVLLNQYPYGSASVKHAEDVEPKEGHDVGINESTPAPTGEEEKGTSVTSGE